MKIQTINLLKSTMNSNLVDVKAYFHTDTEPNNTSETRRFYLNSCIYDDFIEKVKSSFAGFIKQNNKIKTYWIDSDNEHIRFSSTIDMLNAVNVLKSNQTKALVSNQLLLKVHIYLEKITATGSIDSPFCNLLKNACGNHAFKNWHILPENMKIFNEENLTKMIQLSQNEDQQQSNINSNWSVESDQPGINKPLRNENNNIFSNFVSSYQPTDKVQVVDLYKEESIIELINNSLKNKVGLELFIGEYYSARSDCDSIYRLNVFLVDEKFKIIDQFLFNDENLTKGSWQYISYNFRIKNMFRYVVFIHGGNDKKFWAGYYGSKMTNGSVRFRFEIPDFHPGVICDNCDFEIVGIRYKCKSCADFDLCQVCKDKNTHSEHEFKWSRWSNINV